MIAHPFRQLDRQRHMPSLTIPTAVVHAGMTGLMAAVAYALWLGTPLAMPLDPYGGVLILGCLLLALSMSMVGGGPYSRGLGIRQILRQVLVSTAVSFGLIFITLALLKRAEDVSRGWILIWAALTVAGLFTERLAMIALLRTLRDRGFNTKRVALVGFGPTARSMIERVQTAPWSGFRIAVIFDHRQREGSAFNDIPIQHDLNSIAAYVEQEDVREVWITLPLRAEALVQETVDKLAETTATIRFVPDSFGLRMYRHRVSEVHGIPMFDLSTSPIVGVNRVTKALVDRGVAAAVLLAGSPLFLAIALLVKCTSAGPILFLQQRHGADGRRITIYKFRTMQVAGQVSDEPDQVSKTDPRVTHVGALLRRTSLDELPQFINVLQGRMSVVGPRPHPVELNDAYRSRIRQYMRRHKVKPGITGLAQISGWRGETDSLQKMRKRVQYDLFYIEHWSLGF